MTTVETSSPVETGLDNDRLQQVLQELSLVVWEDCQWYDNGMPRAHHTVFRGFVIHHWKQYLGGDLWHYCMVPVEGDTNSRLKLCRDLNIASTWHMCDTYHDGDPAAQIWGCMTNFRSLADVAELYLRFEQFALSQIRAGISGCQEKE